MEKIDYRMIIYCFFNLSVVVGYQAENKRKLFFSMGEPIFTGISQTPKV